VTWRRISAAGGRRATKTRREGREEGTGSPTPEIRYGGQRRPLQEIKVRHDGGLRGVRRVTVRQNGEPVELWSAPRPPTDGRVSHYDASLLNDYADGDSVSSWEDAVGGLTATQSDSGSMPIFDADGINANPALRFDGGHWLEVGLYDQMLSQPYTIVVVAQYDSVGERNHYAFYGADTDERALLDLNRTGAEEFMFWAGTSGGLTQPNDENTHVSRAWPMERRASFAWTTRRSPVTLGPRGKRAHHRR